MPLITIKLLGKLGRLFDRQHQFDINTPAEAVRALAANFPGFLEHLYQSHQDGIGYRVLWGSLDLSEENLLLPVTSQKPLIIVPVVHGSGGVGRIIAGAALIAFAGPLGGLGILGLTATNFALVGGALVLSGVSKLLTPTPKAPKDGEDTKRPSFVFNGAVNTSAQGNVVPICYGRLIVGSQVISAGISTAKISTGQAPPISLERQKLFLSLGSKTQ